MQSHFSTFLKRLPALLALALMPLLTGCATNYYDFKFTGVSRTYEAWKNHKIGTTKEFTGSLSYAGKTFPVRLVQRLKSVDNNYATGENSYFIAGRPGGSEDCFVSATDYGMLGFDADLKLLRASVPPGTGREKVLLSGKPIPEDTETLKVIPNHRTFQIEGRAVVADLYLFTMKRSSGIRATTKAWFSPEIPGGWIAMEYDSEGGAADNDPEIARKVAAGGVIDAKNIFFLAKRGRLTLESVRTP